MTTPLTKKDSRKEQAPRAQGSPTPRNPCPISYSHLPHDYCDGKPTAPAIGSPASGERSEQPLDAECKHKFDLVTHITYPKKCLKCGREFQVKHNSEPRGQQQEWELISGGDGDQFAIIRETKSKRTVAANLPTIAGKLIIAAHNAAGRKSKSMVEK